MDPLASVEDVQQRLGTVTLSASDGVRVSALLDDASELVRLEAGTTWETSPVPGAVKAVVLRMVDRAYRNPDGFSAESDGDYSYQRNAVQPGVYITDAERAIIRRAVGKTGLWNQPVTRNECFVDANTVWYQDSFGCEPFPLEVYRDY